MKSQNSSMVKPFMEKAFTPAELCLILKACRGAKVAELKFGDLQVIFHQQVEDEPRTPAPATMAELDARVALLSKTSPQVSPPTADIVASQKTEATQSLLDDEASARNDELAEMWLSDPARAEQLFAQGELEDDVETQHS